MTIARLVAPICAVLLAVPVSAAQWQVVPAESSIGFSSVWNNRAVEGRFERFQARINFDPDNLAQAMADVTIDLGSATTGDRTVNASLSGEDWFATRASPTARFVSQSISQTGPNQYLARGTLTLRGRSVPVELPFRLVISGNQAVMQGQTRLDRRAFGIGMQSDAPGRWVAFPVPVTVRVTARRAG
ncbi:MAG: YceI family protein [Thermaurantiacus sp.]